MIRFSLLSSGSRANCTYLEAGNTRLLIDCGLSCAQTAKRLALIGREFAGVQAILVTHEHNDHIRGIVHVSRKHGIPVVCSRRVSRCLEGAKFGELFESGDRFEFNGVEIHAVPISHDARDPVGYVISSGGVRFAQFTDLGVVTPAVSSAVDGVDSIVIESNHDLQLLEACSYPRMLKDRIASDIGHLSNESAAALLSGLDCSRLQHAVLGHISENSNNPECARTTVERLTPEILRPKLSIANRYIPTPLFSVSALSHAGETMPPCTCTCTCTCT